MSTQNEIRLGANAPCPHVPQPLVDILLLARDYSTGLTLSPGAKSLGLGTRGENRGEKKGGNWRAGFRHLSSQPNS